MLTLIYSLLLLQGLAGTHVCGHLIATVAFTSAVKLRQSPIISYLREKSDPDVIPIPDTSNGPLEVDIDMSLSKILDVDAEKNEVEIVTWQAMSWHNPALAWDVKRSGFNDTGVSLSTQYLWLPDITVYNAVSISEVLSPSTAYVANNGQLVYVPFIRVRVSCDLENIDSNSGSTCKLKLGSWTQSSEVVSLYNPGAGIDTSEYVPIPNYRILATLSKKNSREYTPWGKYDDIEFQFTIRRQRQV